MSGRQQPEVPHQPTTRQVTVTHPHGICARGGLAIVNTVRRFQSQVQIRKGDQQADASDVLPLMSLGVPQGAEVTLSAQGVDAQEVLDTLARLFADNFGFDV
jgi:phosphotransferase system HPr (HPr) family protein